MRGRLELSATVAGTVGSGFQAYARILHPVPSRRFDLDPSHRDRYGIRDIVEETTWRWSEVARRNGRKMHPLVQWRRLTDDDSRTTFDEGWDLEQVREGFIEPGLLAELAGYLAETTSTPDDLTVAIWEGWGELHANGVVFTESGRPNAEAQAEYKAEARARIAPEVQQVLGHLRQRPGRWFRRRAERPNPSLMDLPGRGYLLFTTSANELRDPTWPITAGIGWSESRSGVMPQLVWPRDAAWCIATEIDFGFTLVGGTREAIDHILGSETLEVFEVDPGDDMSWDGDLVNEKHEPAPNLGKPFT
jgi:hypothetical protein